MERERCKMFSDLYQGFVKMKTTALFEGRMKGGGGGGDLIMTFVFSLLS
jgi:hypothetical protein